MVTETIPVREQEPEVLPILDVCEVGGRIGVPVVIRPWWGSRRQLYVRRHRKCGEAVYRWGGWYCAKCKWDVKPSEIENIKLRPGRWVCPAGYGQQLKWPEVVGDHVVMWEGRCEARYSAGPRKRYGSATHLHCQTLEVLDFSTVAMLVRVSVKSHRLTFLIGRDDGRPFVHVVTRNQTTVVDAYDYLVPLPVFNAMMHGFHCPRQGDFFFVPREFFTVAAVRGGEAKPQRWPGNGHNREYDIVYAWAPIDNTRHLAAQFMYHWPYNLVKGTVTAPDHPPLELETWHCAIRNKRPCAVNRDAAGDDD